MTTSTTNQNDAISGSRAVVSRDGDRRVARETKPSFKTTELIVYVLSVLGVLVASLVVDVNEDGWLDLVMGGHEYESAPTSVFINPGTNVFTSVTPGA